MDEPEVLADRLHALIERRFRAFKIGWGPFGRRDKATDEAIVRAARDAVGEDVLVMVDAGGSDAHWNRGYKWALRTSEMLKDYDVTWFEEALKPDALQNYVRLREHSRVSISGGEVLTRRQSFQALAEGGCRRHGSARCMPGLLNLFVGGGGRQDVDRRPHTRKRTDSGRVSRRGVSLGAVGNLVPLPQPELSRTSRTRIG